jgi:hypothetical protein
MYSPLELLLGPGESGAVAWDNCQPIEYTNNTGYPVVITVRQLTGLEWDIYNRAAGGWRRTTLKRTD